MSNSLGWSPFKLPSCGVLYKDKDGNEQLPDGVVELRPMRVGEEALMLEGSPDLVNQILLRCCQIPQPAAQAGLTHADLLLTDRFAALFAIRAMQFPNYTFHWKCPHCGNRNEERVDLGQDFETITPETVETNMRAKGEQDFVYAEPFEVQLRDAKTPDGTPVRLGLRFLRGKDEDAMLKAERRAKAQRMATTVPQSAFLFKLGLQLVSLNGNPIDNQRREELLGGAMSMYDSRLIDIALRERETGIDTRTFPTCRNAACAETSEIGLPADPEFFRPTKL